MKTRTDLLLEFIQLSRDFDFPDDLEQALENDYAANPSIYNLWTLQMVQTLRMFELTPEQVIEFVHCEAMREVAAEFAADRG